MSGAVLVAIAATVGNLLQGWDNATIAGAVLYIKKEFELESAPTLEGLIVAMSLIGATIITTCSGPISDRIGRRPMMIISSVCFFVSALIMLWSPNVYVLLLGRLLDGFGSGLAVTLVPLYISETAPTEIRGTLNTLPQFTGSGGMFVAYCMVFGMSLMEKPSWRLMLGILFVPSLIYFALTVFFLPESPRWLVSKGKMIEAKKVLQRLRGREDVSAEMALLVEGLGVGGDTSIEEYLIEPDAENTEDQDPMVVKDQIKLYGSEVGRSWVARPVTGQSMLGLASRQGSIQNPGSSFVDPLVTLFGSVHEKLPEQGSMRSIIFPNFGSMFSIGGKDPRNEEWDEENIPGDDADYAHDDEDYAEEDEDLRSPLISHQTSGTDKAMVAPASGSMFSMKPSSLIQGSEASGIGGGWQLAWKWSEREGPDGKKEGGFKRLYLHQEGDAGSKRGSLLSLPGGDVTGDTDYVKAAALVSQPALYSREFIEHRANGPAMVHPSQTAGKGPSWRDLLEPGVRRALVVGVGLQLLQQFSGINGVLYYTPQILEQAGVGDLLSHMGIGSSSASLLISAFTTLLMLPAIAVAMRLMDISGRRTLLLTTIPVLFLSLVVLILGNLIKMGTTVHAVISTISVVLYFCFFVMGFGPIPNILCAEIFPTKIRGLCIAICALTFWIGDIIVTDSLPIMLNAFGLAGVFGFYAVVSFIAWVFIFVKVPETKGMPLEVITEFFALGAIHTSEDKD
ncbi:monosaccharide-sensing protein 2-like [Chenopodium quinoa]|uniref:Major facilitator superfamily (MFS) profile domain-containing protein n=1 Tax=Chenopodium quinoa TaxID=63459 RepID=A0A803LGT2_CHEQI|nr:monosaccharide-sensing protein 2-like [Chenopodium quinoa]XP_021713732.1 monosaccharide-sensing protein 2-like [Chenopodium quinoa]XP_021713739.1 monosaccharide-sensing protein 2-like [Chenopodium quinoa]XP_021713747.1 monosaccharide-sensing protein 2-like [Chenopodium quinoa]